MTFLQLVQRLKTECAIEGDDPVSVTGLTGIMKKLPVWINQAYAELVSIQQRWDFMWVEVNQSVVAGTQAPLTTYTDIGEVDDTFVFWDEQPIAYTNDWRSIDFAYKDTPNSPRPEFLTVLPNKEYRLYPTPSQDGVLRTGYWLDQHVLVNNSDTPYIPAPFQDILIWRAGMFFANHEGANDIFPWFDAQYRLRYSQLTRQYLPALDEGSEPLA